MILAQITDLHVTRRGEKLSGLIDTAGYLKKAVARINKLDPQPDALLITGDMVNDGTEAEYEHLRELLAPIAVPIYVIPGNHDDRSALRAAFADHAYLPKEGFLQYVIDAFPVRIIALDTVNPGKGGGMLDKARLLWLEERLHETQGNPTLIMMHHPPFVTGIGFMDAIGLNEGGADFARLVSRFPNIERILCGHVHRAIDARVGSTVAMACPATCHQISLELRANGPEGFTLEPPGFRLHVWNGKQLVTHTAVIGDYPGPYGFG
jgi:3',5'-cyclic AMP phosphodiesterase CpdA